MFDFIKEAGIDRDTSRLYVLDRKGAPERCDSAEDWARWMEHCKPIALAQIGTFEIVTCFTGEDIREDGDEGDPILWQTTTAPPLNEASKSYRSNEEAIAGHTIAVEAAADALKIKPVSLQMCAPERREKESRK